MPARTGQQYLDGLDDARDIWLDGERMVDVRSHPALRRGVVATVAELYDMQYDVNRCAIMTYTSPSTGDPVGTSFIIPKTPEDLLKRRRMMQAWAEHTCGMMGRSPDFVNINMMGFALWHTYFGEKELAYGNFCIAADQQHHWKRFCELAGLEALIDDPRFATNRDRVEHLDEFQEAMETALVHKTSNEWNDLLSAEGIPCGPVYRYDQVFDDPHVQHRQMAVEVDHPKASRITLTNTPLKLSQTPGQVRMPALTLSQHTDEILRRLGYDDTTIAQYHDDGVV